MAPVFLLVALIGSSPSTPTTTTTFQRHTVVVTVRPPEGRTVKSVALLRDTEKRARAPQLVEPAKRDDVRATFEHPHTAFNIIVTLDDGTTHRLEKHTSVYAVTPSLGDLLPVRPLPSPPY